VSHRQFEEKASVSVGISGATFEGGMLHIQLTQFTQKNKQFDEVIRFIHIDN
jgi:hypothetical protein